MTTKIQAASNSFEVFITSIHAPKQWLKTVQSTTENEGLRGHHAQQNQVSGHRVGMIGGKHKASSTGEKRKLPLLPMFTRSFPTFT
jgi:hypothetical protein